MKLHWSTQGSFSVQIRVLSTIKKTLCFYRDALITCAVNTGTALIAGVLVFSILGYMANLQASRRSWIYDRINKSINQLNRSMIDITFCTFREPRSRTWSTPVPAWSSSRTPTWCSAYPGQSSGLLSSSSCSW